MTEPVLWDLDAHTAAKHRVLRAYLGGWIPVMAQQGLRIRAVTSGRPRLLLVDGFAGPGRYATGEPGSPLIMLDALLSHTALKRFGEVTFTLLFIEQDRRRVDRLRAEVAGLGSLPTNISVHIEEGSFETAFGSLIDAATDSGRTLIPTFAFIDPFGYSSASMSLTGRLLDFPRCEALVFLPLTFVHRFVGRAGQEAALTSLFDCEDWREAILLQGAARRAFLMDLFECQLGNKANVAYVRSFQLQTQDGNDYRLVFGLGHRKGLEIAKDAMWKVDPVSGTLYTATTDSGQEVLFSPNETVDTAPLLAELRAKFGTAWFTIKQAEECTLIDTPFRIGHLRQRTLQPAEDAGRLEVRRPRHRGYDGAKMRFTS